MINDRMNISGRTFIKEMIMTKYFFTYVKLEDNNNKMYNNQYR